MILLLADQSLVNRQRKFSKQTENDERRNPGTARRKKKHGEQNMDKYDRFSVS